MLILKAGNKVVLTGAQLLDPSGETAWIRHAAGAARLIELRGPQNYSTEFERALLMAHTGSIVRTLKAVYVDFLTQCR